jgi:hypothetical protein
MPYIFCLIYCVIIIIIIIFSVSAAQCRLWPPRSRGFLITRNDAPQSVGLLWTIAQPVAETFTRQHTQQTNIHTPGGVRTHDCSRRVAVDLRLRPRVYWDRRYVCSYRKNIHNTELVFVWIHEKITSTNPFTVHSWREMYIFKFSSFLFCFSNNPLKHSAHFIDGLP